MEQPPRLILVVDDEATVTELLRLVLEADGHEVIVAADGRTAVSEVGARRPDLVILDIDMPHLDGFEVCAHLKSDRTTRMIPILVLTGVAAADRMRAWELGADEFLTKPFQPLEVAARARSLLRQKDLVDALDAAESVVFSLVRALEGKSPYTHGHSERVLRYALALAKSCGLSAADIDILRHGVVLHDIGKISTPDSWRKTKTTSHPPILAPRSNIAEVGPLWRAFGEFLTIQAKGEDETIVQTACETFATRNGFVAKNRRDRVALGMFRNLPRLSLHPSFEW